MNAKPEAVHGETQNSTQVKSTRHLTRFSDINYRIWVLLLFGSLYVMRTQCGSLLKFFFSLQFSHLLSGFPIFQIFFIFSPLFSLSSFFFSSLSSFLLFFLIFLFVLFFLFCQIVIISSFTLFTHFPFLSMLFSSCSTFSSC